ncbi:MAG: ATP-binding protein [Janthinobacterium lividum]
MNNSTRSPVSRYGPALAAFMVSALLYRLTSDWFGPVPVFIWFLPTVAVGAWFGGAGGAALAAVLGGLGGLWVVVDYAPVPPQTVLVRLTVYSLAALFSCYVIVSLQRSRLRAQALERAAVAAQRAHEQTLASIGDGVVAVDPQGYISFMNPVAEGLTGWLLGEARGRAVAEVVVLRTAASGRVVAPLSDTDAAYPGPWLQLVARDGTERPVSRTVSPLRAATATAAAAADEAPRGGAVMVLRDATAMQQQGQIDALLRAIVASSNDAIVGVSEQGLVTSWNDGARRLFAYDADEILGTDVALLIAPELRGSIRSVFDAALSGERIVDYDVIGLTSDGRHFDAAISLALLNLAPGGARGLSLALRDIGERRSGERRVRQLGAQLVRRAQELQTLFDVAPVAMAIAEDADCQYVRPNFALARMLEQDRSANVAMLMDGAVSPWRLERDGRPLTPEQLPLREAVRRRAPVDPVELELVTPSRRYTVLAHAAPVIDQNDRIVGCIGVLVDISEIKRSQAERDRLLGEAIGARRLAEEASRLKEEFLATVSHELRTPLNAIYGWLEIMERRPDAATQQRGLTIIRRNVQAQTRVIEDILDVSAIVTGKARLDVRLLELEGTLLAVQESLRPTADAKGVMLSVELAASGATVMGDPDRLQQIVWNLASNAIKFTPAGGSVRLRLSRAVQTEALCIDVMDSGEGIEPAFLPYVFDRFRQADSSTGRRHAGLGLGLAIVRHLVELHGGTVAAASDGIGHGARFTVSLPLAAQAAASIAVTATPDGASFQHGAIETPLDAMPEQLTGARVPDLAGRSVLIVEDDSSAAEVLAHGLREVGAHLEIALHVDEALTRIHAAHPEIIVSDIGLPGRDGYVLLHEVRQLERKEAGRPAAIALAISAYARPEDRQRAFDAGFDAYVVKPALPSVVIDTLLQLLRRRAGDSAPAAAAVQRLSRSSVGTSGADDRMTDRLIIEEDGISG